MEREFIVAKKDVGKRLDIYLKKQMPAISRAFLQLRISKNEILVNNAPSVPDHKIKADDHIQVKFPAPRTELLAEPELALPVLWEDDDLLVINKPPGIVTHPLNFDGRGTVVNWAIGHYPAIREVGDTNPHATLAHAWSPPRSGIVHRLDKWTSGVLILAKTQDAFFYLKNCFKERLAEKEYIAILDGIPRAAEGTVAGYLTPSRSEHRKKRFHATAMESSSKLSRTRYVTERIIKEYCLTRFFPETGRTHQIRVHAASLGTPVLGDRLYGAKTPLPKEFGERYFLHARHLTLPMKNGKKKTFSAPIPPDFKEVMAWLDPVRS